jgi:hypothetical protein
MKIAFINKITLTLVIIAIILMGNNFYISWQVNTNLESAQLKLKETQDKLDLKLIEVADMKTKFTADKDFMLSEFNALIDVAKTSHKKTYVLYSDKLIKKWQNTLSQEPKYSKKSKASRIADEQFERLMAKENLKNQALIDNLNQGN